ncbi:MAG: ATP-dependent helicase [Candidatus Thermoplasmatota archaeon]|nr:ATP-dependent helicase [Candidatus Thermoplasmatota archaeon]
MTKVDRRASTDEVLSLMHPVVSGWFRDKFGEVTEAQAMAVPLIHGRKNVLVSSPTGSGKTLTAFLSILNELILLAGEGRLEDRIYAVYVSPLKALANDINENLLKPLAEISEVFRARGLSPPEVRVAVRTGDTLQSERQRQARTPPHIFITTPESLALVLSTPVFSKKFAGVDYVIIDEVHEVCDSKRGVALSVAIERLQSFCPREFVRIGLSATVAPIGEVAEYLVGQRDHTPRDVSIVEVFAQRDLDLQVLCPAKDMTALSFEVVNSKMYDMLRDMIREHRTTLVFTNTRSGAESVVYKLKERGLEDIGTHHGSLSRETRMDVEGDLRNGLLKAVVSSTSLELGIDIGSIDLVLQIGSPKSVAKGLQRIGRAGHQYGGTSKGRIVVFEPDDLIECAVLCRAAHLKAIDRVTIPSNSLDVLAQVLVGLSIERKWGVDEAYELVRRSYCYRDLSRSKFESVLRYLGAKDAFEGVYSKLWYDEDSRTFGKKRGSRMIFYLNQGTIPEESDYTVYSERGSPVGSLSEKFVERLSQGDIFVLGGRSYEFLKSKGTKAFVKSASGRKPTVPSWTGEMLPRSFDLSVMVARFRREMEARLDKSTDTEAASWLIGEFGVDEGSATTIVNYFKEQKLMAEIPTDTRLLIEGYVDASGNRSAIFHFPFGRRVNDALSRAYASRLSERMRANVTVSVTDDSFMLTAPKGFALEDLGTMLSSGSLEQTLRSAVRGSELFQQRFRHVATRSFMVLRNYKGRELSVARQQLRSSRLLDALHEIEDFPVMSEAYEEIMTEVMDLEHAEEVLRSIESGERQLDYLPFSGVPSPFAHNVILVGISDIVLMEDRSMLLRELHRKVLARVLGDEAVGEYQFEAEDVERYFEAKFPRIRTKQDILKALRTVGPMNLFREKGENIFGRSDVPFETLRRWAGELLKEGKARSVWIGEDVYVSAEHHPVYVSLHRRRIGRSRLDESILEHVARHPMTSGELAEALRADRGTLREALRRLESANEIFRSEVKGDQFRYSRAPEAAPPHRDCLEEAIERHMAYHAPITVEDLAYEVGVSESDAEEALRELVRDEVAVSGRFVVGEQQQFMLAKDYLHLRAKGSPVFDRETIRAHSEAKQFAPRSSIREFFEQFGEAGMIYDIFQRVEGFDMEEFGEMRRKGDILLGRLVRGKLRYVLAEDAPSCLGAFRRDRLDKYEAEILAAVQRIGSGTYQEIQEAVGFPSEIMREHFDSLDRKGWLLREYDEAESWSSRNIYRVCDIEPDLDGPYEKVLRRHLRGFGPVTLLHAAAYLDLEPEEVRPMLDRIGAESISVGLEQTEMFLMPDELRALEEVQPSQDALRILSLYDSYLSDKWTEITSRFGEGWIFPLVRHGRIVGMIEKWLLAGSVEIRQIHLDEPEMLGPLIDAFDTMMPFYNALGVEILRITSVFGTEVSMLAQDVKAEFLGRGFAESNGMLVKGRLVIECFEQPEILSSVFSLQNLGERTRLKDMSAALERYGGLRQNSEALLRVRKFENLQRLHKRGAVVRGRLIPDKVGFCTPGVASVYRSARLEDLDKDEKLIMRIIRDQQPVKRERLVDLSPLGRQSTLDVLRGLYASSRVYLDGNLCYVAAKRIKMSKDDAWAAAFRRMFDVYGVMSAEGLASMLGHEIPMRNVRRILRRLEDEGHLVKGFMLKGSGTLYWASKKVFASLGKAEFTSTLVIAPSDNLVQYLRACCRDLLPETGRHAIFRGVELIGSFEKISRGGRIEFVDIQGQEGCESVVADYARRMGAAMSDKEDDRLSDWEIVDFYHRTHPGASTRWQPRG